MKKDLTFEQLCEMEPELEKLYTLTKMFAGSTNPDLDKNWLWYTIIKPGLYYLIGWGRLATPVPRKPEEIRFVALNDIPDKKEPTTSKIIRQINPASQSKNKILWTSEAWEVAVETIMNQIPE